MSDSLSPYDDPRFVGLIKKLQDDERELNKQNLAENPVLIGDYLEKLRLGSNRLFEFLNHYIGILTELEKSASDKRQEVYEEQLKAGKSPSAADTHSRNMTRKDEAQVKVIQNHVDQIKNEYARFNGTCMYLQSRMKEFNTERMMG